jgi:hypothetical protein
VRPWSGPAVNRSSAAEASRILSRYKRLILLGKARLPLAEARRLVGPDCAYHLYFRHAQRARARRRRTTRRRGAPGS